MLETPYVFVDTQVFVASGFDYDSGRLAHAKQLAVDGRIRFLTTDITRREIISNIQEAVSIATGIVQKLRQKGRVLATSKEPSFDAVFNAYDEGKIVAHLADRLREFETDSGTTLLDIGATSTTEVFRKYFERRPPFSDKKKSEFPDAFVLQTLEDWCSQGDTKAYVISGDSDTAAACEASDRLIHLDSLEELFEIIATEDEELGDLARQLVESCFPGVKRIAGEKFKSLGFYLEDQEGDVSGVDVREIEGDDLHIVEIDRDTIYFVWEATVTFSADVVYDDMNTAIYDSEDKVAYAWQEIDTELERSFEISIQGEVRFNRWPPHDPSILRVGFAGVTDVGITVEEWDSYK